MSKHINIVSFDVPYPPNYGGVIDVFFKIKALYQLGIKITLHTFEYGRGEAFELNKYCENVYYYKRTKNINQLISSLPFIVKSRKDLNLIQNLKSNNYPILFEGLHTTFPILKLPLKNRNILVRSHNIEHHYYLGLSKSEPSVLKKVYFLIEALKLKKHQSILNKGNYVLSISKKEDNYLKKELDTNIEYIPAFHQNSTITSLAGKGDYALYHGDLSVGDNIKACKYLCEIFSNINYNLIIAGNTNNKKLIGNFKKYSNIKLIHKIDNKQLNNLIINAHINILPTFQNTGIKLKLINALFNGRFCLVNNAMIENTGLENLCETANTKHEFQKQIKNLFQKEFSEKEIEKRKHSLVDFNNIENAKKIIALLD